jgi:glyoxylase-like metal-dependent hydrolase (beta-lactamase superfamily II)
VFCDTLMNLPRLTGLLGLVLHPTGTLSVPRPTSLWFAKDRPALRASLQRVADEDGLVRVIPGHGEVVASGAAGRLREAAARLGE